MKVYALVLTFVMTAIPAVAETAGSEIARKALDAAIAGDYDTFAALSTDNVKQAITKESLSAIGRSLQFQFGAYAGVTGVETVPNDNYRIFTFSLDFERAVVKMTVALDAESLVAGLRIVGTEEKKHWTAPPYVDESSFRESEVKFGPEDAPLPGTLSLPVGDGKVAAVVLLHGSGPNDRDESIGPNKIFKDIAWGLASRGIAVLRFEKRTKQYAQLFNVAKATLDSEVIDDAIAAVDFLKTQPRIDPERVFVLGHSLGGMAAPYVAKQAKSVAGLIVIAGPGQPTLDILTYQMEYLARLGGTWNDKVKAEVERIKKIAVESREGKPMEDEKILGQPASYWIDLDRRNAPKAAADVARPILVIHGGRDYQVTDESFAEWQKALGEKSFARLIAFAELNHLMIEGEGQSTPTEYEIEGHVDRRVIDAIARFVLGEHAE